MNTKLKKIIIFSSLLIAVSLFWRIFIYIDSDKIKSLNEQSLNNFHTFIDSIKIIKTKTPQSSNEKLSINTATIEELQSIKGIGPKTAEKIIRYRNKTKFKSLEELKRIKGIGEKKFQKMKDLIRL
jgi:comEA protein